MSIALYDKGGLRFWNERELLLRQQYVDRIVQTIKDSLRSVNRAWQFQRCEAPMLVPSHTISDSYSGDDVFLTSNRLALRPETTAGSYRYAEHLLDSSNIKLPLCVYQVGKSYRVEKADGASASKLRYNEFTQLEFQCIYSKGTKADYRQSVVDDLRRLISLLWGNKTRVVHSDRLPSYSLETIDIEVWDQKNERFVEIASISIRSDFPRAETAVLEVAFGIDRLVDLT